ncbi:MAG TPA: cell division protein ZapA [Methylomirabilota bacterium]|nr:cell division protein ZapA [Methylomirabilota bacterium]
MSDVKRVELTLLGQTLVVRTEATPEYVRLLARHLEQRVEGVRRAGVPDHIKSLLLAALEITDELFRLRDERARDTADLGARLDSLQGLLERATR